MMEFFKASPMISAATAKAPKASKSRRTISHRIPPTAVNLDAATFRVFVGIGHLQPTSVGDLAAMMGKNYSSVSRQIDKLETTGLVHTYPSSSDSRIRVSELTQRGEEINAMIKLTRERKMREGMADWSPSEKDVTGRS